MLGILYDSMFFLIQASVSTAPLEAGSTLAISLPVYISLTHSVSGNPIEPLSQFYFSWARNNSMGLLGAYLSFLQLVYPFSARGTDLLKECM